ncbi:MAG TPA: hypothetical protein G4O19_03140 [Dehalococcoidia bacterium]|nr:hypothetical protein [Dehalococcoidia bacterium]
MPPVFKTLATIMVWIFWLAALVYGFSAFILGSVSGLLYSTTEPAPIEYAAHFAVAALYGLVAVVIMLLRKKME